MRRSPRRCVYCRDRLGIPMERLNVNGGSISIGHPFGMTGSQDGGHAGERNGAAVRVALWSRDNVRGGGQGAAGLIRNSAELTRVPQSLRLAAMAGNRAACGYCSSVILIASAAAAVTTRARTFEAEIAANFV